VTWEWSNIDTVDESEDDTMTQSAWDQPSVPLLSKDYLLAVHQAYAYIYHICNTNRDGIDIDQYFRRDWINSIDQRQKYQKIWTERNDGHPPRALRRMGLDRIYSESLLQGSCVVEMLQLPNPLGEVMTSSQGLQNEIQASIVATFDRKDDSLSPPTVSVSVSLDTPILSPVCLITDYEYDIPPPDPPIPMDDSALQLMAERDPCPEPFQSEIDKQEPSTIVILDPAGEIGLDPTRVHKESRRSLPTFNEENFRIKCFAHPMEIHEEPYRAKPFRISESAVTPNQTSVNPPTRMHSEDICTSVVSRPRTPREIYDSLMEHMPHRLVPQVNDPLIATVRWKGYEIGSVEYTLKEDLIKKQQERNRKEERKKREENVFCKMEAAERIVERRVMKERQEMLEECTREHVHPLYQSETGTSSTVMGKEEEVSESRQQEEREARDLIETLRKGRVMTCSEPDLLCRTVTTPRMIGLIDPCQIPEKRREDPDLLRIQPETKFITNVLEDRIQMARGREENKRYQEMILSAPQQEALAHILRIPVIDPVPRTNYKDRGMDVEREIVHAAMDTKRSSTDSGKSELNEWKSLTMAEKEYHAILAVKSLNFTVLEELLDGNAVNVETQDEFGNTLFILACQQASKKMAKFLLRRGASINAQNHSGNTALHYLYEYDHVTLANYLLEKGADDTLLNAHGFTCFEGVTQSRGV
jgi:hypothetical protein